MIRFIGLTKFGGANWVQVMSPKGINDVVVPAEMSKYSMRSTWTRMYCTDHTVNCRQLACGVERMRGALDGGGGGG